MKDRYRISLPNPCDQSWENMLPADKGRHCMQCSKTVVDFSMMTDTEILSFLQQYKNKTVCGRFLNTQLDKTYRRAPQPFLPTVYRRLLLGLGLTASLHLSANAQQGPGKKLGKIAMSPRAKASKPMRISGMVRTSNGIGIKPQVQVSGDSFLKSITVDEHGYFSIELPATQLRERLVVEFSAEGYETQTYYGRAVMPSDNVKAQRVPDSISFDVVLVPDIERMPTRTTESVAAITTGMVATDGGLSLQGARGEVVYYIDGVQMRYKQPKKKTFWQRLQFWK